MTRHNIAEMNVAAGRWPMNDSRMAEFVAAIAGINAAADVAAGFVWRMPDYLLEEEAIEVRGQGSLLVNMSLWSDVESLREFTYGSADHLVALRRRREWFQRLDVPNYVMWWVPEGELPTVAEGRRRLGLLAEHGPTAEAFTFASLQPPPGLNGRRGELRRPPWRRGAGAGTDGDRSPDVAGSPAPVPRVEGGGGVRLPRSPDLRPHDDRVEVGRAAERAAHVRRRGR